MTVWFLAFLAIAWFVVFVPSAWRARQRSPLPAVERFKRRMRLISPRASAGRWIVVPEPRQRVALEAQYRLQRRRMGILGGLIGLAVLTAIWAIASDVSAALEVHLVADAAITFYVALLLDAKRRRAERSSKVRTLSSARTTPPAELYEPIEASGGRRS